MRKLVDFRLIDAWCQFDCGSFQRYINEAIQEGFELHGQLLVTGIQGKEKMLQAMAKYEQVPSVTIAGGSCVSTAGEIHE